MSNDTLTSDLQKLTNDWEQLRDELMVKEDEWKEEEHVSFSFKFCKTSTFTIYLQTFNEYYTAEHNRLLNLWRDVMSMKKAFLEVRSTTEQDLAKIRTEMSNSTQDMNSACLNMANSFERSSRTDVSNFFFVK